LVVLTVPSRSRAAVAAADLSHAVIGCSEWGPAEDGRPTRWVVEPRAQFFIRAHASYIGVPLRLITPDRSASAEIAVYLDGRLADRVRLTAGTWVTVAVAMPDHARGPYYRVEVEVGSWHASARSRPGRAGAAAGGIQMGELLVTMKPTR
jgi:hypothetical protein